MRKNEILTFACKNFKQISLQIPNIFQREQPACPGNISKKLSNRYRFHDERHFWHSEKSKVLSKPSEKPDYHLLNLNIWHLEIHEYWRRYTSECNYRTFTCVDYHPYNHVPTYFNINSPTAGQVLRFNKNSSNNDVNPMIMTETRGSKD